MTSALRFELDVEQATPHEPRRIVREDGRYFHQWQIGSDWQDVYEFTGEVMPPIDREVGHWFTSTHPQSHFRNRLIVARAGEQGQRLTLVNGAFKVRQADGRATQLAIDSPQQLLALLDEHFGLRFAPDTRFGPNGSMWPA